MGEHVRAGDLEIWTEQVGDGPDVLSIGGLGDTVESWQFQLDGLADRYRLIAFDNMGAGRTTMPEGPLSAATMADDAAAVLRALEVAPAHVAGFSMGSAIDRSWRFVTPSSRAASCCRVRTLALTLSFAPSLTSGAGCPTLRRASVRSSRPSSPGCTRRARTRTAYGRADHRGSAGLSAPAVRRGVPGAGRRLPRARHRRSPVGDCSADPGDDTILPPRFVRAVAEAIPGARFEVLLREAHQPFQEIRDEWNARVDAFWGEIDAAG